MDSIVSSVDSMTVGSGVGAWDGSGVEGVSTGGGLVGVGVGVGVGEGAGDGVETDAGGNVGSTLEGRWTQLASAAIGTRERARITSNFNRINLPCYDD